MKKEFKEICKMPQDELKEYAFNYLTERYSCVTNGDGFVYAHGTFPVLLVAHMDTVHEKLPTEIIDKHGVLSSPNGIGGDDRCGIYMILNIIKEINCSVLFCEDEEIGGIGAGKFVRTKLAQNLVGKFNYIIEFDRKGKDNAVFYDCGNEDFEEFITKDFYKSAWGSFSDISIIAPELECAAVNLSCGYYNAHTKNEYVVWSEMQNSIKEAKKILRNTTEDDKFEYIEVNDYLDSYFGGYSYTQRETESYYEIYYKDNDGQEYIYETVAITKYEAIGFFCTDNPQLSYNHITEICCY